MTETSHSYPYVYSVRFEGNKKAYSFGFSDATLAVNDAVVVETSRGVELGTIVTPAHETANVNIPSELKPILRKASPSDINRHHSNAEAAKDAIKVIEADIKKLKLNMTLVSADYTLDRSKIVVVYVADERVDFRDLLKELAGHLHCRIELRQIGPRDKAKVIGGIGTCGQETCCSRFKSDFDVISINMAKNQNLALNIQKLSGQCGKLMCCLKYEDENYKCMKEGCPKMNEQIDYNGKRYRVTSINLLTRQAKLENREESLFLGFDEAFKDYTPRTNEKTEELSK